MKAILATLIVLSFSTGGRADTDVPVADFIRGLEADAKSRKGLAPAMDSAFREVLALLSKGSLKRIIIDSETTWSVYKDAKNSKNTFSYVSDLKIPEQAVLGGHVAGSRIILGSGLRWKITAKTGPTTYLKGKAGPKNDILFYRGAETKVTLTIDVTTETAFLGFPIHTAKDQLSYRSPKVYSLIPDIDRHGFPFDYPPPLKVKEHRTTVPSKGDHR